MNGWTYQVFLLELRRRMTYRSDFWINFFGQTIFSLLIAYYLWNSIFESTGKSEMNGFTMQGMIFYYLIAPLVFRIQQGQGIGFISREIYEGGLNKYLLYPVNYFKFKLSTYLATSFFYTIQLIVILIIYQLFFFDRTIYEFNFIRFTYFLLALFGSALVYFYLSILSEALAFWHDNVWSIGVILRFASSFLGGALIPLSFFPQWSQELLQYTPFPYLIHFPVQLLTKDIPPLEVLASFGILIFWIIIFYALAKVVWNKGSYSYSGVGI